jgi:hypothetical protein
MNLLKKFLYSIQYWWQTVFGNKRTASRAEEHALGALCGESPHTITSIIEFKGSESQDWSADYKLYSRAKWQIQDLFDPIMKQTLAYFTGPYVNASIDDSIFKKTGKKIKTASRYRDPMSPAFHANLMYGIRFLQISLTLPLYEFDSETPSRAIPIDFIEAPTLKKPKKKASKEEWKNYRKKAQNYTISAKCIEALKRLRARLDEQGFQDKILISTHDNAFCNKRCLSEDIDRTVRVMRSRKDIKLCHRSTKKGRFYAKKKFTPEGVYQDNKIPWLEAKIFRAGKYRNIQYKEVKDCFWQSRTKRKPYTLIVLKKIPYHPRKGHTSYREPAYLLCEQSEVPTHHLIQAYHDHPGIELNFKDEKWIGVGDAQVRNEKSVARQPAFVVATYSSLLLAALSVYREKIIPPIDVLPSWQKDARRPSTRMLIKQLKKELLSHPDLIHELHLSPEVIEIVLKIAA